LGGTIHSMKKHIKRLLIVGILVGVAVFVSKKSDKKVDLEDLKEKLFSGPTEDLMLKIDDKMHLLSDIVQWPIEWVQALLP
jgi:septation ring formation regulator EzrA